MAITPYSLYFTTYTPRIELRITYRRPQVILMEDMFPFNMLRSRPVVRLKSFLGFNNNFNSSIGDYMNGLLSFSPLSLYVESYPVTQATLLAIQLPVENDTLANSKIKKVIDYARKAVGKAYRTGTHGPSSYDCSGLIYSAYKSAGEDIPLNIFKMIRHGKTVPKSEVREGDVLHSKGSGKSGLHVSLVEEVLPDGRVKVIEARGRKYGVVERVLSDLNHVIKVQRMI